MLQQDLTAQRPHPLRQPVQEGLEAATEVAELRRALRQPSPEPGQVHVLVVAAELALQQRLPEDLVGAGAQRAPQPAVGCGALKGAPEGIVAQEGGDHAKAQAVDEGQWSELQHPQWAVQRVDAALVVDRGGGAAEEEQVRQAQLPCKADDLAVTGEDVMVEAVHRPVPALVLEPGGQAAHIGPRFVDRHAVARLQQIVGRGQAGHAGPDDPDIKSLRHGLRSLSVGLVGVPRLRAQDWDTTCSPISDQGPVQVMCTGTRWPSSPSRAVPGKKTSRSFTVRPNQRRFFRCQPSTSTSTV